VNDHIFISGQDNKQIFACGSVVSWFISGRDNERFFACGSMVPVFFCFRLLLYEQKPKAE